MKQIELWRFRYFDVARKRYRTTSYVRETVAEVPATFTECAHGIRWPDGQVSRWCAGEGLSESARKVPTRMAGSEGEGIAVVS